MSHILTKTWWNRLLPFQNAKAFRKILAQLLEHQGSSTPNHTTILAKLCSESGNVERLLALHDVMQAAAEKRKQVVDLNRSDYTPNSAKTFHQVQQGYWACNYLSKEEEFFLCELMTKLVTMPNQTIEVNSRIQKEANKEANIALTKFKPRGTWFLFYLGKLFAFLTALGAGFCGAMVAIFLTAGWGWPALLVSLAGIVVFAAHFILEIVLNRYTTPRHLVNIWLSGFMPTKDEYIPWINFKTYFPMVLSLGSAAQVATLTYVSTQSILASSMVLGPLTAILTQPITVILTLCSLVTIGCLLYNSSYTIYRAPKAWAKLQSDKIKASNQESPLSDSQREYRYIATALTGLICTAALIFYCHTIISIAFASAPIVGWVLAIGFNIPALIPFVIDKSFDIASTVAHYTDWIIRKAFPSDNANLSAASLAMRRGATLIFTLVVAATLPIWGLAVAVKAGFNSVTESFSSKVDVKAVDYEAYNRSDHTTKAELNKDSGHTPTRTPSIL